MVRLLKFSSVNCVPCKMMHGVMAQFKKNNPDIVVEEYDVNIDGDRGYGITSVPTIIIEKDGEVINKLVGLVSQATLESAVKM